jgi:hypothetical protein
MLRCRPPAQWSEFIDELIAEAESEQGTWSLATYTKIQTAARLFPLAFCDDLLQRMQQLITTDSTKPTTRYKLAQMASAIYTLKLPEFDRLFPAFEAHVSQAYDTIRGSGKLGPPTVNLLESLAIKGARTPDPIRPPNWALCGALPKGVWQTLLPVLRRSSCPGISIHPT